IQNWVEDLFWKQLDLNYPGIPDAMALSFNAIIRAKRLFGDIPIMVTGHSIGREMASFCALDLSVNFDGSCEVQFMTFGQPRIGNSVFASYFIQHVTNTIRVTHAHDIVPHFTPYYTHFPQKTYHHLPREVNPGVSSIRSSLQRDRSVWGTVQHLVYNNSIFGYK
ncbi:hypothetical protein MKX03_004404, partial [Papaver bracteatum]